MSEQNSWTDAQGDVPTPPAKKKMSGCMLAGLIVGGVGLVGLLICCGASIWIGTSFAPKMTTVPAEVEANGKLVLNMAIPPEFKPQKGMTMDNMVFTYRNAQFKHQEGKGELGLGMMKFKMGDATQANAQSAPLRAQIEAEITSSLDVKKTESHDIMVDGQNVSVAVAEATDRPTGKAVHTAKADIKLPMGLAFVILRMDDDVWDQDAVLKMLEEAKIP